MDYRGDLVVAKDTKKIWKLTITLIGGNSEDPFLTVHIIGNQQLLLIAYITIVYLNIYIKLYYLVKHLIQ
jgi:hypothetical protein